MHVGLADQHPHPSWLADLAGHENVVPNHFPYGRLLAFEQFAGLPDCDPASWEALGFHGSDVGAPTVQLAAVAAARTAMTFEEAGDRDDALLDACSELRQRHPDSRIRRV